MLAQLQPVIDGLGGLEAEAPAPEPVGLPDAALLRAVIDQLDALLLDSDGAAVKLWDEHTAHFRALCPAQAKAVSAALADFDFDLARDALRGCREALASAAA